MEGRGCRGIRRYGAARMRSFFFANFLFSERGGKVISSKWTDDLRGKVWMCLSGQRNSQLTMEIEENCSALVNSLKFAVINLKHTQ